MNFWVYCYKILSQGLCGGPLEIFPSFGKRPKELKNRVLWEQWPVKEGRKKKKQQEIELRAGGGNLLGSRLSVVFGVEQRGAFEGGGPGGNKRSFRNCKGGIAKRNIFQRNRCGGAAAGRK